MIEHYEFGNLIFNNKTYTSDLIITPTKIICPWQRLESHLFTLNDIELIKNEPSDVIIIGQGYSSCMQIEHDVLAYSKNVNKLFLPSSTQVACDMYNKYCASKKIVAFLHLTC